MLAGTLFAPPSPAVAAPLPDHLVNGDFQYPTVPDDWWIYPWGGNGDVNKRFLTINPGKARAGQGCRLSANGHDLKGFDRARFGWASTQDGGSCPGGSGEPGNVELNRESGGNVYGEITADQERTTIYQDIAVTPGAMYTVSLRHASSNRGHVDSMHVLVGAPGRGQPIDMTRITSNGHGDRAGGDEQARRHQGRQHRQRGQGRAMGVVPGHMEMPRRADRGALLVRGGFLLELVERQRRGRHRVRQGLSARIRRQREHHRKRSEAIQVIKEKTMRTITPPPESV